jgi:tetratricopeptide (TPR) repeat protein
MCLSLLRQHFLVSEATTESVELKRAAKEHDARTLRQIELLLKATSLTLDQVKSAIEYIVEYPLPGRPALAEKIVERIRSHNEDEPELLWYLARCYMAEGRWDDAHSLLAPLAATNDLIREHLHRWQGLLSPGYGPWTPRFGTVPNNCDLDVTDAVNRGLIFLANALYHDAREWLLFALEKAPRDPFALFGHGLFLWRQGWFSLATKRLELAKDALESYPAEFRFVTFARIDETCEPRSYRFNPLYPIFNIADCIERVESREPFVSYAIIP